MATCIFCEMNKFYIENEFAGAFFDKYPVSEGHLLIIPKNHKSDYFSLSKEEKVAIDELIIRGKKMLDRESQPSGFNIGVNCGEDAGQSVMHCHIHLIPRYHGDMKEPLGGVRGVIPEKQKY
ncbi:HIT family protein [Enterococcus rivorum]|uniref:Diadenosine tetraphosphate hydrolase n=1 Tax=Enterococcus rivorum TaxID=762845 RepID=A0A1E5L1B8_9ENTE|nr:HIT family protein [Enterococcus rivorum]MBP2098701.1 diadenosine tetraphosphate (Ap4A) HIT family hydrolase [Enterococcus rivorum]OEH83895.1 diadenosine tetraphosphate hydrolase [Enterococcus rivorum]